MKGYAAEIFGVTKTDSARLYQDIQTSCLGSSRAKKIKADPVILGDADHCSGIITRGGVFLTPPKSRDGRDPPPFGGPMRRQPPVTVFGPERGCRTQKGGRYVPPQFLPSGFRPTHASDSCARVTLQSRAKMCRRHRRNGGGTGRQPEGGGVRRRAEKRCVHPEAVSDRFTRSGDRAYDSVISARLASGPGGRCGRSDPGVRSVR